MATDAPPDDTKPKETRPKKKDKRPEPTNWTETFWALVISVVTALIAATAAVIVGFLNAPKPQDGGAHPVIDNIVTYLLSGPIWVRSLY